MKSQQQYKNFQFGEVVSTYHAEQRLKERFGLSFEDVMKVKQYFKCGNKDCRHKVVRNKIASYNNQKAFYNEKLNILFMVDVKTKEIAGTLYLDGRDGYEFMK